MPSASRALPRNPVVPSAFPSAPLARLGADSGRGLQRAVPAVLCLLACAAAAGASSTLQRVSVAADGTQANGASYGAAISGDGRYIAFYGYATNLATGEASR